MKTILIILALVLSINTAKSQLSGQAKIDSLLKELPKMKEDTNGVNLLKSLSFEYYRINPDEGIKYGKKGLKLAKELNWNIGIANCLNSIGNNYLSQSKNKKALEYFQKSLALSKKLKYKIGISKNLGNIGIIYDSKSNYKKAIEYHKKALKIDEENDNTLGIVNHINNIGNVYNELSENDKALEYYNKALKINNRIGNMSNVSINLQNIGKVYFRQSNYPKALEYSFRALKINENLGDLSSVAAVLEIISGVYFKQSNFEKSIEMSSKALKINEKLGDKGGVAYTLANIGSIYGAQSNYPKSLEYYEKALKKLEDIGNEYGVVAILGNIGAIYALQSKYTKALEYLQKSLNLCEKLGIKEGEALNLGNIGEFYLMQAEDSTIENSENKLELILNKEVNLNKAIDYSLKAIELHREIGELHYQSNNLVNLSKAYQLKGDFKNTLEYYKEYKTLQDSIFSSENQTKIANLEAKRENELKEKEIVILKKEKENQKLQRYAMFGGIAGLGIIIGLILIQRRKSEKLLLNVLPVKIAKRLKAKEHPIADHFDGASIMFIDIVGFTKLSSDADPKRVVSVLNDIFTIFDKLADTYGLEKIKTIGDAYMAVAGIPEINTQHAKQAALMALEVKQIMTNYKTADGTEIKFRIGIDCGAVVAGVIGEKKFIYDLWSDAVNTASRMESTGESGQIQITENFKTELEKFDGNWNFTLRGEFEIKGKGLMKTYFLD